MPTSPDWSRVATARSTFRRSRPWPSSVRNQIGHDLYCRDQPSGHATDARDTIRARRRRVVSRIPVPTIVPMPAEPERALGDGRLLDGRIIVQLANRGLQPAAAQHRKVLPRSARQPPAATRNSPTEVEDGQICRPTNRQRPSHSWKCRTTALAAAAAISGFQSFECAQVRDIHQAGTADHSVGIVRAGKIALEP